MAWYLLYSPLLSSMYELLVTDKYIAFLFKDYNIIYLYETDRLIVRLPLGKLISPSNNSLFLDLEAVPSTILLDALENLLIESVVLAEE